MNTNPVRFPRWEHLILFPVVALIWLRLQTLLIPFIETFVITVLRAVLGTRGDGFPSPYDDAALLDYGPAIVFMAVLCRVAVWLTASMWALLVIETANKLISAVFPDRR